jgi:hypothetical protein
MAKRNLNLDTKDIQIIMDALEMYRNEKMGKADTSLVPLMKKLKNNTKTISVASRKSKGRNLQKFVCQEIADLIGVYYDQGDDQCLLHSREMGQKGTDIVLRGNALAEFPFSVEAKCSEGLNLLETYNQVLSNVAKGTDWMIVHQRKSIPETLCIISWDTFKRLFKKEII